MPSERSERDRLAELEAAIRAADNRVRELDAECRKARRSHERAVSPLRSYWVEVGRGDRERDPEREAELEAAARDADATLTMRPVLVEGRLSDLVPVDERLEAQLAGAREALAEAEGTRDGFLATRGPALVAEALPEARELLAACRAALDSYGEEVAAYEAKVRELIRYGAPSEEFPEPPRLDGQAAAAFRLAERRGLFGEEPR